MKKFVKTLGILVGLPLLYLVIHTILTLLTNGFFIITNPNLKNQELLMKFISSCAIPLSLITGLIMLLILILLLKTKVVPPCRFNKINLKTIGYLLMFCFGTFIFIDILTSLLTTLFPSYKEVAAFFDNTHSPILTFFFVVIFAPVFEEIFFRGVIFGYLKKNYNLILAIILQALAFGIIHRNIVQGVYAFLLGIILGIIYCYTDSLYSTILFHLVFNFLGNIVNSYLLAHFPYIIYILVGAAIVCIIVPLIKIINTPEISLRK